MYLDYKLLASFRRVLESLSPLAATEDNLPRVSPPKRSGSVDLTEKWGSRHLVDGCQKHADSFLEIELLRAVCDSVLQHRLRNFWPCQDLPPTVWARGCRRLILVRRKARARDNESDLHRCVQ